MPNWCENFLEVQGSAKEVKKFKDSVKTKESVFSFGGILTVPAELEDLTYPTKIVSKAEHLKSIEEREKALKKKDLNFYPEISITKEMNEDLIKKYGASNWYEWTIKHWGTKWDASDPEIELEGKQTIGYRFETAWSPPIEWLQHAQTKFPKLNFRLEYREPGMGFEGVAETQEGKIVNNSWEMSSQSFQYL
jgi:hypothetical protein